MSVKDKFAEDFNYWMSGKSSPDKWTEAAKKQIEELGGKIVGEGFGSSDGRGAFMLAFSIEGATFKIIWPVLPFKIIWPVLPSKTGKAVAARLQAATTLYHYVKAVCLYAVIVGSRTAFFSHLILSDGRVASQTQGDELLAMTPNFLLSAPEVTR